MACEAVGTCTHGLRSSRPKVITPEVMSPETRVMLPEIHSHVARNFKILKVTP